MRSGRLYMVRIMNLTMDRGTNTPFIHSLHCVLSPWFVVPHDFLLIHAHRRLLLSSMTVPKHSRTLHYAGLTFCCPSSRRGRSCSRSRTSGYGAFLPLSVCYSHAQDFPVLGTHYELGAVLFHPRFQLYDILTDWYGRVIFLSFQC